MFQLPDLAYDYDALEPVVSAATMRLHHDKHHAKYVETANGVIAGTELADVSPEEVIQRAAMAPDRKLFNNAAQAWNHAFFWNCMCPSPSRPAGDLAQAITSSFGNPDRLKETFLEVGAAQFGSGWVWLTAEDDRLSVFSTHDADTVVTREVTPLLVCDLWEHAYYLDHHNDRVGFLNAWWDRLANWDFADAQFAGRRDIRARWSYPLAVEKYVTPIRDRRSFERALGEAGSLLQNPPTAGSEHDRRLHALLVRIARYESAAPAVGDTPAVPSDLDSRIRKAAREASASKVGEGQWSPMVGGELSQ